MSAEASWKRNPSGKNLPGPIRDLPVGFSWIAPSLIGISDAELDQMVEGTLPPDRRLRIGQMILFVTERFNAVDVHSTGVN